MGHYIKLGESPLGIDDVEYITRGNEVFGFDHNGKEIRIEDPKIIEDILGDPWAAEEPLMPEQLTEPSVGVSALLKFINRLHG